MSKYCYRLRQFGYKILQVLITNYGRSAANHDKMYYILRHLKYFITTFWSYYNLRQKVITNSGRFYKLRRYCKLCCNIKWLVYACYRIDLSSLYVLLSKPNLALKINSSPNDIWRLQETLCFVPSGTLIKYI